MRKRIFFIVIALSASVFLGSMFGNFFSQEKEADHFDHSSAVNPLNEKLEEEFWNVDLVIKGTVIKQNEPQIRDAGITGKHTFSYTVTPATIQVNKVLYGELSSETITYLQHGTPADKTSKERFVHEQEEVILLLVKTSDGKYWSYNFGDGIWKIKDGKMQSLAESKQLAKFKGESVEKFLDEIPSAVKNKTKNPRYK